MITSYLVTLRRTLVSLSVGALALVWPYAAFAAGSTGAVGPQGDVGPQGYVGSSLLLPSPSPSASPVPTSSPAPVSSPAPSASPSAASASQSNADTGANSTNANAATSSSSASVTQNNAATMDNAVNATMNTGGNALSQNTSVGDVKTGDINGAVTVINVANSTFAAGSSAGSQTINAGDSGVIALSPSASRTDLSNSNTGSGSQNGNVSGDSHALQVVQNNQAAANNQVSLSATTGGNSLTQNSQVGNVKTGDINLAVNLVNLLNVYNPNLELSVDAYSLMTTNPNAVIVVPSSNSNTGADSTNTNAANVSDTKTAQVTQKADLSNFITAEAVTGNNALAQNTSGGGLTTGDTRIEGNLVNLANAGDPTYYVVNVFGDWDGTLQGVPAGNYVINRVNDTTGAGSDNSNLANASSTSSYTLNNQASAVNAINVNAVTGGNTLDRNTAVGSLTTGSVNVLANVINALNGWGSASGKFTLGIINVFGPSKAGAASVPAVQTVVTPDGAPVTVLVDPVLTASADPQASVQEEQSVPQVIGTASQPVASPPSSASSSVASSTGGASEERVDTVLASSTRTGGQGAVSAAYPSEPAPVSSAPISLPWQAVALPGVLGALWLGVEVVARLQQRGHVR